MWITRRWSNWVGRYRAHGPAALHDSRHSSEGTRRAKGRVRAVAPMQRLVIVLDCLENRKNYGAMAQKYAVAYHQVYRWVQRYLQDGWLGMNDRRGPADDPGPEGEWARVAPANEDAAENGWPGARACRTPCPPCCAAPGTAGA